MQKTQPKEWKRFLLQNKVNSERKFCLAFNNACDMDGLISVLRHGFKHRGIPFKVCYFKPESGLNQTAMSLYEKNEITCNRQWFYSNDTPSVDMVLAVSRNSGICTGIKESVYRTERRSCKTAVMYDRDPREICFQFNKRILGYFCIDQLEVWMTTKLEGRSNIFSSIQSRFQWCRKGWRKRKSGKSEWLSDGVLLGVCISERQYDGYHSEVYPFANQRRKETFVGWHRAGYEKENTDISKISSVGCGVLVNCRCTERRNGAQLSDPAQCRIWKIRFDCRTAYRLASLHDANDISVFSSVIVVKIELC